jgi:hypothetical protein
MPLTMIRSPEYRLNGGFRLNAIQRPSEPSAVYLGEVKRSFILMATIDTGFANDAAVQR